MGAWVGGKRLWAKTRIEKGDKRVGEWEEKSSRECEDRNATRVGEWEEKSSRRDGKELTM